MLKENSDDNDAKQDEDNFVHNESNGEDINNDEGSYHKNNSTAAAAANTREINVVSSLSSRRQRRQQHYHGRRKIRRFLFLFVFFSIVLILLYQIKLSALATVTIERTSSSEEMMTHPGQNSVLNFSSENNKTNSTFSNNVDCPFPLRYYGNRIIQPTANDTDTTSATGTIPKLFHVSMNSRCLPQDIDMYIKRWEMKLPEYSILFYDDDDVHSLIYDDGNYWSEEFGPWLQSAMKCVLSTGAMTIDIWRILILYRYGGIYSDIDNWPEDPFDVDRIVPASFKNVSGFTFSDKWDRPSQWFFAFEANHPLLYLTMEEIITNLLEMKRIRTPQVVFVTGPFALRQAYVKFMNYGPNGTYSNITFDLYREHHSLRLSRKRNDITTITMEDESSSKYNIKSTEKSNKSKNIDIFKSGAYHTGMSGKVIYKDKYPSGLIKPKKYYSDLVPNSWYNGTTTGNATTNSTDGSNMIKREKRIERESGIVHWRSKQKHGDETSANLCRIEQEKWKEYKKKKNR